MKTPKAFELPCELLKAVGAGVSQGLWHPRTAGFVCGLRPSAAEQQPEDSTVPEVWRANRGRKWRKGARAGRVFATVRASSRGARY